MKSPRGIPRSEFCMMFCSSLRNAATFSPPDALIEPADLAGFLDVAATASRISIPSRSDFSINSPMRGQTPPDPAVSYRPAVGAVNRDAGHLSTGIQARNNLIIASAVDGKRLAMNIGRDATHHVMAGGHDGNRLFDRDRRARRSGTTHRCPADGFKYLLAEMIELQYT